MQQKTSTNTRAGAHDPFKIQARPSRAELLAACEKWPERVPCDFEDTNFQKWLFAEWVENEHATFSDLPLDAGLWTGRDWLEYFDNTPFH